LPLKDGARLLKQAQYKGKKQSSKENSFRIEVKSSGFERVVWHGSKFPKEMLNLYPSGHSKFSWARLKATWSHSAASFDLCKRKGLTRYVQRFFPT